MNGKSLLPNLSRRVSQLQSDGYTRATLRGQRYERPYHGLRRPGHIELEQPAPRIADAIGLMTDGCVLTGWASRWLQGQAFCDGVASAHYADRPVTVLCGPGSDLRTRPGIRPSDRRFLPGEVIDLGGFDCTTMARGTYDDMLDARNRVDALIEIEMATSTVIAQARTSLSNVRAVFDSHVKTRGRVQARWAMAHACTRSASPWETRTRVLSCDAVGVEEWLVNVPVFDRLGHLLGVPDLLDPRTGLVVESDGEGHRDEDRHNDDNEREESFESRGLTVVRIGAKQHGGDRRARTIRRLRSAYQAAATKNGQRWTIDKPPWWTEWEPGRRWD